MIRKIVLASFGIAALAGPALAQEGYPPGYERPYVDQQYGQPSYRGGQYDQGERSYFGQPRGDWDSGRYRFGGYPEFQGIEDHIRGEIAQALRDDLIERDDAADLFQQLRGIRRRELREFRVHGWNLPPEDREQIRSALDQLDRLVDQTRDEQ